MSDREAFEKWAAEIDLGDNLVFDTSSGCVGVKDMAWEAWQAAQAQAGGGEAVTVEDIVLVTGTVLFSAGSQSEEAITLGQISKYLTDNKLYTTPPAAVNQQLLEALHKLERHLHAMMAHIDHKPRRFQEYCWQQVLDIRDAIAAAQSQEPDTKTGVKLCQATPEPVGIVGGYEFAKTVHFYESKTPARVGDLLYATPPAAVPDAIELPDNFSSWDKAYRDGWNACREAILAAQSQEPDTKTLITDRKKWRVDDLVQDINGDVFTIDGVKGDKLLIKDAGENLWLTLADELTWHSRPTENQNSET